MQNVKAQKVQKMRFSWKHLPPTSNQLNWLIASVINKGTNMKNLVIKNSITNAEWITDEKT